MKNLKKPLTVYTRRKVALVDFPQTKTKQSFKDDCDINHILKKYETTGILPRLNDIKGHYGDFSDVEDYQSALNTLHHAQDAFNSLPSKVRARFGNDPGQLLAFVSDNSNRDEAITLGLIEKPLTEAPVPSEAPSEITNER